MKLLFPVRRHAAGRAGHRLIQGVVMRRRQLGSIRELIGPVVVEPVLAGLETLNDRVTRAPGMVAGVLGWR